MKLVAPVLAALMLVLVVTPSASAAKRKPTCALKGSKTVKSTRDVRVSYRRERFLGGDIVQYYGCLKKVGKAVELVAASPDDFEGGSDVRGVTVAGWFVGYEEVSDAGCSRYSQCPADNPDGVSSTVGVTDLRRDRFKRDLKLSDPSNGFVITQRGGLAVLTGNGLTGVDGGGTRVLDTGTIPGDSLKAEISIVSWVRDGVERFARLR